MCSSQGAHPCSGLQTGAPAGQWEASRHGTHCPEESHQGVSESARAHASSGDSVPSHPTQAPSTQNNPALQSEGAPQAAPSVVVGPGSVVELVDPSPEVGSLSVVPWVVVSRVVCPVGCDEAESVLAPPDGSVAVSVAGVSEGEKQALNDAKQLSASVWMDRRPRITTLSYHGAAEPLHRPCPARRVLDLPRGL